MTELIIQGIRYFVIFCLVTTVVSIIAFLVMYGRVAWYKSELGRVFMLNKIAYAVILGFSIMFRFWKPDNPLVTSLINGFRYGLITYATALLTYVMIKMNFFNRKDKKDGRDSEGADF